jgi:hypothetical protein
MGWARQAKEQGAASFAQQAIDAGRHVLVYKFIEAITNSLATGPMSGMNEQIEAIEAVGWKLDKMSVTQGSALGVMGMKTGERVVIVCMFRRVS